MIRSEARDKFIVHLDKVRGLGYLAVPHVRPVDAEEPVVGADPAVQGCDRVVEDLHDEDPGLGAAAAYTDTKVLPRLMIMIIMILTKKS